MSQRQTIRLAIAGVGNCANALVQGINFYENQEDTTYEGLMQKSIAGLECGSIEIVAAFDIDRRKVGSTIEKAIFASPNCAKTFYHGAFKNSAVVQMAPILDGVAVHMTDYPDDQSFRISEEIPVNVSEILRQQQVDVLISYMPVGADKAAQHYAQACLDSDCAFVNCTPSFIASDPYWAERFREANLPIVGDDIKSQVGATIVHRALTSLFGDRGINLKRTYQLNVGGNTDFLNMLARERLTAKKQSKTNAVRSMAVQNLSDNDIAIGPSDYIPWQKDGKIAFIRMEGEGFGGSPVEIELRLNVQDSPNSAGVAIDAIRYAALAKKIGIGGPVLEASAWLMKSPPKQMRDEVAKELLAKFVATVEKQL